jgi:hypothetical protein
MLNICIKISQRACFVIPKLTFVTQCHVTTTISSFPRHSLYLFLQYILRNAPGKIKSPSISPFALAKTRQCTCATYSRLTLVDLQLDAKNSYLCTYNILIKILYMFRALSCSSSGGLCRNCICVASGIVTLCRWLSSVTCREWRYQRLHMYNYDVDLLKMSSVMLETCRGF